jgi:hypothetical protein
MFETRKIASNHPSHKEIARERSLKFRLRRLHSYQLRPAPKPVPDPKEQIPGTKIPFSVP